MQPCSFCFLFSAEVSFSLIGEDFSGQTITVTIPADSGTFEIPQFFTVEDDNIDENNAQSFAIVAEIGPDVPDDIACFQTSFRPQCEGRRGATEIRIVDNDRKLLKCCGVYEK